MASRWGRSKRREAREAAERLGRELEYQTRRAAEAEARGRDVADQLARVVRAVEEIEPHSAVLPPKTIDVPSEPYEEWRLQSRPRLDRPWGGASDRVPALLGASYATLHRLIVGASDDPIRRAVWLTLAWDDSKVGAAISYQALFLTREALERSGAREMLVAEVAEALVRKLRDLVAGSRR